jgi:serine protease Do
MQSERNLIKTLCLSFVTTILTGVFTIVICLPLQRVLGQHSAVNSSLEEVSSDRLQQIAKQTTVRIVTAKTAGSGVIIAKRGNIYTVITNWHVVESKENLAIITVDAKKHKIVADPKQLANKDLALVQFQSQDSYEITKISQKLPREGESVYAAGFPLYYPQSLETTLELGVEVFSFTQGKVSLILPKSLPEGYLLGYTNDIQIGMSGGPIFNQQGLLIGINGRTKNRDPSFGVYTFEDGSEPSPIILERMANSSLGIPISTYLNLILNSVTQNEVQPIDLLPDIWIK